MLEISFLADPMELIDSAKLGKVLRKVFGHCGTIEIYFTKGFKKENHDPKQVGIIIAGRDGRIYNIATCSDEVIIHEYLPHLRG